jgi:hypothetical protein
MNRSHRIFTESGLLSAEGCQRIFQVGAVLVVITMVLLLALTGHGQSRAVSSQHPAQTRRVPGTGPVVSLDGRTATPSTSSEEEAAAPTEALKKQTEGANANNAQAPQSEGLTPAGAPAARALAVRFVHAYEDWEVQRALPMARQTLRGTCSPAVYRSLIESPPRPGYQGFPRPAALQRLSVYKESVGYAVIAELRGQGQVEALEFTLDRVEGHTLVTALGQ